ncbi:MAG: TRAP transporter large permease, partial [Rhodobacterales bacterium]|nr:TRAP transporter large permease [Rhodobacterales bacterium]
LSRDIYRLAHAFIGQMRGGLALATIAACAGFGAISGSSIATAATMTRVAFPEMMRLGYSPQLAAGSVAGGGSLGIIIPPSIIMVLYAILTEQSVLAMFLAGVVPGIMAVAYYFVAIAVTVRLNPAAGPAAAPYDWPARRRAGIRSWRVVLLAVLVSGGIYGGVFTVNEAAAIGAGLAFLFYLGSGRAARKGFLEVLGEAAGTTSMIYMVILGASTMTYFVAISQAPSLVIDWIVAQDLPRFVVLLFLMVLFLILGSVFDTTAGMVITLPFVFPLVTGLGYDPVWWGVMMVVLIEVGMITPPIGLNVFVMHGMLPEVPLRVIFRGIVPFLLADIARLLTIAALPDLVTYLPRVMGFMSDF